MTLEKLRCADAGVAANAVAAAPPKNFRRDMLWLTACRHPGTHIVHSPVQDVQDRHLSVRTQALAIPVAALRNAPCSYSTIFRSASPAACCWTARLRAFRKARGSGS